jgi:hypothetical protein
MDQSFAAAVTRRATRSNRSQGRPVHVGEEASSGESDARPHHLSGLQAAFLLGGRHASTMHAAQQRSPGEAAGRDAFSRAVVVRS